MPKSNTVVVQIVNLVFKTVFLLLNGDNTTRQLLFNNFVLVFDPSRRISFLQNILEISHCCAAIY